MLLLLAALVASDTSRWVVTNHGRQAGELVVVRAGDSVVTRYIYRDRNRGTRLENRYRLRADGTFEGAEARPLRADDQAGDAAERLVREGDDIVRDTVRHRVQPRGWYGLRLTSPWELAATARYLLAQPGRSAPTYNGVTLRAQVVADTILRRGGRARRARLVMVHGAEGRVPDGVWLDEKGELLASDVQWFIAVREEARALMPALRAIELRWRNAEGERISASVRTATARTIAVVGGDVFDSDAGVLRPRHTVVIEGDRITRTGPADQVAVPAGATVIDATGKTVLPGMWDMHAHVQVSNQSNGSLIQLAQGITTARDLAADVDVAVSHRDRERAGKLASPRYILSGFLEGPLSWAGPSEALTATEAGARAWVAHYDSLGYRQIKLYNVLHPDLVPTIAAEAKRRGMKLSGHIPRGMSVRAAVSLGFDEIQHAAFLLSDFFPDSLYLPAMRAYSQVATAVAPDFDVDAPGMQSLIAFLSQKRTVIDGTFNLWIGGGASVVGAGGSANQRRADSTYMKLIRRLYEANVPMVPGTDNFTGATYHRELQMYALAGIPLARVLQMATIESARFMGEDRDYGSLAAGKVGDLVVVDGRPLDRLEDLGRAEVVLRGGRMYRVADLRKAAGLR